MLGRDMFVTDKDHRRLAGALDLGNSSGSFKCACRCAAPSALLFFKCFNSVSVGALNGQPSSL